MDNIADSLPSDRPLTDAEIAIAVARAILDDRQNPGANLPFQPQTNVLLARLGIGRPNERAWMQQFITANRDPDLDFRMAEYCWRLVGLGYLVPRMGGDWGLFHPTVRGREFLDSLDPVALSPGGLDQRLSSLGYGRDDAPRQYARQAQDCFLAGHYESSIVMLGVANEAVIHSLVESFSKIRSSRMPSLQSLSPRATARQEIEWLAGALTGQPRGELRSVLTQQNLQVDSIETLRDLLSGTSQTIRLTRNEYGHPTGFTANQEDALPLLTMFPRFAAAAVATINNLASL